MAPVSLTAPLLARGSFEAVDPASGEGEESLGVEFVDALSSSQRGGDQSRFLEDAKVAAGGLPGAGESARDGSGGQDAVVLVQDQQDGPAGLMSERGKQAVEFLELGDPAYRLHTHGPSSTRW
jgi:hypothetical protein